MWQRFYFLILCAFNSEINQRCILNSRVHFGQPLPVIIRNERLLEPNDNNGNVELNYGEAMILSCEGAGTITHPSLTQHLPTASITCAGGENFRNDNWLTFPASFSFFRCSDPPNNNRPIHCSERTNRTCFGGNQIVEVGYRSQNQFYPVFESCFDHGNLNPIYSKYTQKPYNALYQTKVDRPYFVDDGHYGGVPVDTLFSPKNQRDAVAKYVGPLIETYVTESQHLSRGHLAAKTDFVFAFSERATFHYVNCAPQWTGFNGGNWNTLEVDLRNHIHYAGYDTIVYTGTYGVTELKNHLGLRVEIYLYSDVNNNQVIRVPQYYYKVVYEPSTQRGIAFVGINNPYYTANEARELFFCKDICRSGNFRWLSWHPDNPAEGYAFCCTVADFRNTIKHLPDFEVTGLLM
ncbi:uncharacterized protein LOC120624892 [Pararge aegeria]|uniref:Jg9881 protein n=1 Tax=Pararge aegeria aegeria TaxID=348720 RepID=A0A8S4RFK3_9NEOP|nr:uncharacterized protein LOC120624892 [Pararge aegeria]CAH2235892.1 jg9881 [Pararge aegeria aegeria]